MCDDRVRPIFNLFDYLYSEIVEINVHHLHYDGLKDNADVNIIDQSIDDITLLRSSKWNAQLLLNQRESCYRAKIKLIHTTSCVKL